MEVSVDIGSTMSYSLREALLIYRQDGNRWGNPGAFVARHPAILDPKGVPSLGPGELLPTDFLSDLVRDLSGSLPTEILPGNVLVRTTDSIVWYVPPAIRTMFYFYRTDESPELAELSGKAYPQPPLLLRVSRSSLSMRALKTTARPTASTPVFRAPYWNVYEAGAVCLGTTSVPQQLTIDSLGRWEESFFESEFTHPNATHSLTKYPKGLIAMWRTLAGKEKFPLQYLAPTKQTVKDFIAGAS